MECGYQGLLMMRNHLFVLTRRRLLSLAALPAAIAVAPAVCASPRPIAEEGFVPIGGIEQWVAIRGHDRSRTAILFLHGGPCDAQSPHLSLFASWEERYVVAQWDQRGSGKTFEKNGPSTTPILPPRPPFPTKFASPG